MKTMYIVMEEGEADGESYTLPLFVTASEDTALAYSSKFNRILRKAKAHYKLNDIGLDDTDWDRYRKCEEIQGTSFCYYTTIEER